MLWLKLDDVSGYQTSPINMQRTRNIAVFFGKNVPRSCNFEMVHVVDILPRGRYAPFYPAKTISSFLTTWRRNIPALGGLNAISRDGYRGKSWNKYWYFFARNQLGIQRPFLILPHMFCVMIGLFVVLAVFFPTVINNQHRDNRMNKYIITSTQSSGV